MCWSAHLPRSSHPFSLVQFSHVPTSFPGFPWHPGRNFHSAQSHSIQCIQVIVGMHNLNPTRFPCYYAITTHLLRLTCWGIFCSSRANFGERNLKTSKWNYFDLARKYPNFSRLCEKFFTQIGSKKMQTHLICP